MDHTQLCEGGRSVLTEDKRGGFHTLSDQQLHPSHHDWTSLKVDIVVSEAQKN